jgi:hypothetical protein
MAKTKGTELVVIEAKTYAVVAQKELTAIVADNLDGEPLDEFDLPQIKTPSGGATVWTVPASTGDENTDTIEGVVIHVGKRRQYWESPDPSGEPPDCSSRDLVTGQGNPGGPCGVCPHNEFGTSVKQSGEPGRGKACKESRAIFMYRASDHMPIVLSCSPASLGVWKKYLLGLKQNYYHTITRFTLGGEKNADGIKYAELQPTQVGLVPDELKDFFKEIATQAKKTFQ